MVASACSEALRRNQVSGARRYKKTLVVVILVRVAATAITYLTILMVEW